MSKDISNTSSFAKAVITLLDAKDKTDTGAFAIIMSNESEVEALSSKVEYAKTIKDASVRGVILEFFASEPEGEKTIKRYADLVELGKQASLAQKAEKARHKQRLSNVNAMLLIVCDVYSAIKEMRDNGFETRFRRIPNTGAVTFNVRGLDDDAMDYATLSVAQVRKLVGHSLAGARSYARIQEIAKASASRTNAPDTAKDGIAPAAVAKTVDAIDGAIAGLDFGKADSGLSPAARAKLLLLWARLDAEFSEDQKVRARAEFGADDAADALLDAVA